MTGPVDNSDLAKLSTLKRSRPLALKRAEEVPHPAEEVPGPSGNDQLTAQNRGVPCSAFL